MDIKHEGTPLWDSLSYIEAKKQARNRTVPSFSSLRGAATIGMVPVPNYIDIQFFTTLYPKYFTSSDITSTY